MASQQCKALKDNPLAAWSQSYVDRVWRAAGFPPPAPILPPSMEGKYPVATRGPRMLTDSPTGKARKKTLRGVTKEENKFLNFWGINVTDPCRKQSGISKVAGGILDVAGFVFPVLGYMQVAATAVNTVQDVKAAKANMANATDILTQAAVADLQKQQAAAPPGTAVQLVPTLQPTATPAAVIVRPGNDLEPAVLAPVVQQRKTWTTDDYLLAGMVGLGAYLLLGD